jgi:RecG-like helicase
MGITSLEDMLLYLPRSYKDYSSYTPVAMLKHGDDAALYVRITAEANVAFPRRGLSIVSVPAQDETGTISSHGIISHIRKTISMPVLPLRFAEESTC